ncbi:MAG: hypothetical protein QNI84_17025 [Henriciella sp.]|nr:hypothetical protein [Henriciella sp.]
MSYWHRLIPLLAASALFSAPALADGTKGKTVNRGPNPLQAKVLTPPRPGCRLTEDGQHWACPAPTAKPAHKTKTVRRVVKTAAPAPTRLTLDTSGFNGGVGAGIDGGYFYGGGGTTIIFTGARRYSGVTQHAASRVSFRGGSKGGKRGSGCGC